MLSKEKIQRINELSHKSKSEGLSNEEKEEQQQLRKEYLESVRASFKSNLMGVKVIDPDGNDVTPNKLKKEQRKQKKH